MSVNIFKDQSGDKIALRDGEHGTVLNVTWDYGVYA